MNLVTSSVVSIDSSDGRPKVGAPGAWSSRESVSERAERHSGHAALTFGASAGIEISGSARWRASSGITSMTRSSCGP